VAGAAAARLTSSRSTRSVSGVARFAATTCTVTGGSWLVASASTTGTAGATGFVASRSSASGRNTPSGRRSS
jgi:hypothetical protein